MDPFDEHKDNELWAALEAVKLHEQVLEMPAKLDAPVTESKCHVIDLFAPVTNRY